MVEKGYKFMNVLPTKGRPGQRPIIQWFVRRNYFF